MKEKITKCVCWCHMLMMAIGLVWATNTTAASRNDFAVESDGVMLHFTSRGSTATLVSCDDTASGEVVIPSNVTYEGLDYTVVAIGSFAFSECGNMESVTLPATLQSIGDYAFYHCTLLKSLAIPDAVSTIGTNAFDGCSALASVQLPSSIKAIEDYTFYECSSLLALEIPSSVRRIGAMAFKGCRKMSSISIPENVTSIGRSAFSSCGSLKSVDIPCRLSLIEEYTFSQCSSLTSVTIPNSVTFIDEWAFWNCPSLEMVVLPSSVSYIGDWAFASCRCIREVHSGIEKPFVISEYVFERVVKENATLHVPADTKGAYRNTRGWEFTKIEEGMSEPYGLVLWSKEGKKMAVYALSGMPKVTFDAYGFTVSSTEADLGLYDLRYLARFTYEKLDLTDVRNIVSDSSIKMEGETLVFPSLRANSTVSVYAPNGTMLYSTTTNEQGDYAISLSGLSRGVFIVKVNGSTYKIVRK